MFTDIVGYTTLMQSDEAQAIQVRTRHREVFERLHRDHQGKIIQYYGDGTLSIFESAVQSVACAIQMQQQLQAGKPVVPIRIGLHLGDIVFSDSEVYGDGVNVASRIESMSVPGAILLSAKLNEELSNQRHIMTRSMGKFTFKNVVQPLEVFAIANPGLTVPTPAELKGKRQQTTKSIAVLPLVNMSASAENEYFSDGMTEEIINALTKIKELKVTSRTSSFFFKNKQQSVSEIGRELNVSTILEGSVRLAGNQMRITVQLIDVADDFHFWSETFDRPLEDVFAVQDEISLLIADRLREHLGHFEIEDTLVDSPEVPAEVYQNYLRSRYHLLKMSKPDIEIGFEILRPILSDYPNYPLAHLGMHMGYTLLGVLGLMPAFEAFQQGKPYLDRAIELDETLPDCQLQLSWISFLQEWDLPKSYQHINRALEIRPTVDFYQTMASVLVAEGKYKAATHYVATAQELDPFSEIGYHLMGYILYCQEKYEPAIEQFAQCLRLKADSRVPLLYWGQALLLQGKHQDGLTFFQNLADEPADLLKIGGITLAQVLLGNTQAAQEGISQLQAALETDMMERATNLLILCQTVMGNYEAVIGLLEQGVKQHLPMMVYLDVEPMLKPLRQYPRFHELMQQVLGTKTTFTGKKRKYKKSLLKQGILEEYREQLLDLMQTQQPHLNPDLTLRDLAEMLNIPANQMSQLLNEGFNQNFAEFINSYRLEAFKEKVADPSQRHLTILALSYDSGFNSKTVFNTFFKKAMGQTPKAYWKAITQ